ncbi:MAG: hypothetical protein MUC96_11495 [Myxococcaceae bacterium]|jgi:hypothetical protein|nr:hypothetical protein [Myxococcaceae bacterium]
MLDDAAWSAFAARVEALEPDLRKALARRWSEAALAEHASIASFARFTLQLLAVGAPPSLLADAHRAGLDEIEHARLSFRVASRFAGQALGPGPLPIPPSSGVVSLLEAARAAVLEGCIAETLAANEARHAAERCVDPLLRTVMGAIAEDEGRHAELAWAFAGWALEVGDDAVRTGVAAAAEVAMREAEQTAATGAGPDLSDWGALPEALRLSLAREHLARVIRPALDHLMKRHAGGRTG